MYIVKPKIIEVYDSFFQQQVGWPPPGVSLIAANKMWPCTRGEGSIVAIVDTGIDYEHPDLKNNVLGGISFVPGEPDYLDLNGHGRGVQLKAGFGERQKISWPVYAAGSSNPE